jgi:malate dehydrogenase (oxaloacetate-decarboxylating)(NADP+)
VLRGNREVIRMESTLKEMRQGPTVLDMDPKSTVGGGVADVYGEDQATEDLLITPWTLSVARSHSL